MSRPSRIGARAASVRPRAARTSEVRATRPARASARGSVRAVAKAARAPDLKPGAAKVRPVDASRGAVAIKGGPSAEAVAVIVAGVAAATGVEPF